MVRIMANRNLTNKLWNAGNHVVPRLGARFSATV